METKRLIVPNRGTVTGFVLGLLVALFSTTLLLRYYAGERFWELYYHPAEWPIMGAVLSLGSLPNLLLFFYFLKIDREHKAKGVLSAVVLIAAGVLIIKLSSL